MGVADVKVGGVADPSMQEDEEGEDKSESLSAEFDVAFVKPVFEVGWMGNGCSEAKEMGDLRGFVKRLSDDPSASVTRAGKLYVKLTT